MPDTPARVCIRCGAPRPPHATKYCPACRLLVERESRQRTDRQRANRRTAQKRGQDAEKAVVTSSPAGCQVVRCVGCKYWQPMHNGRACHYAIDTGRLRGIPPRDCYGHAGTPYTPER